MDLKPHLDQTRTLDRKPPLARNQGPCTQVVRKRHLARTHIPVALKLHLVLKVVPAVVAMGPDHKQHLVRNHMARNLAQTLTLVLK